MINERDMIDLMQRLANQNHFIIMLLSKFIRIGEEELAQIDDIDAALASQANTLNSLLQGIAQTSADIATLQTAVKNGTPVDLSKELAAIQANNSSLLSAVAQVQAADASAQVSTTQTPTPTPAPAPTPTPSA